MAPIRFIAILSFAIVTLQSGTSLSAQSDSDRTSLDAWIERLDAATASSALPPMTECQPTNNSRGRLCEGLLIMRRAELDKQGDDIEDSRRKLDRVAGDEPKWALAWYGLGRARLVAAQQGAIWHEGPLQLAGMDNAQGAAAALERALKVEPTLRGAALILARSPVSFVDKKGLKSRVASLRLARAFLSPQAQVEAALFELDAGSPDSAVALLRASLRSTEGDSTNGFAQLTFARALYRIGKPKEGRAAYLAGADDVDSAGVAGYQEQISWVGDSAEMKAWKNLQPAARSAWLAAFWAKRDAREGRADGERLTEHFRRVNYAYEHFRQYLPASGQQISMMDPAENEYKRWLEERAKAVYMVPLAEYTFPTKCVVRGARSVPPFDSPVVRQGADLDTLRRFTEYFMTRASNGAQSPFRSFDSQQSILDDRGLIYIRHGEPTRKADATPNMIKVKSDWCAGGSDSVSYLLGSASAIWRYDRSPPESPLILYFINKSFLGSGEPNVLVPTLRAEDPDTRAKLCVVDQSLCPVRTGLMDEILSGDMSNDRVLDSRMKGLAFLKDAITSDAYPRDFSKVVHLSVEMHGLDQAQGGAPRLVIGFALPGNEIRPDTIRADKSVLYPVLIQLIASRASDGKRVDLTTLRQFPMPRTLVKGEFLAGLVELPLPPGEWTASAVFTQPDDRGALATVQNLRIPDYKLRLTLSELVLGRDESGLKWHSGPGGQSVAFNPLNTFPVGSSASVYAQVAGLNPGEAYTATIELFEGREPKGAPALKLDLPEVADAARAEISRKLGLANLKAGRYIVRLTIRRGEDETVTTAGLEIVK